jgi:hypothetical protein
MQQGLALHELLLLLKVLKVLNTATNSTYGSLSTHHITTHTNKQTIVYDKKQLLNSKSNTKERAKEILCFETITWI